MEEGSSAADLVTDVTDLTDLTGVRKRKKGRFSQFPPSPNSLSLPILSLWAVPRRYSSTGMRSNFCAAIAAKPPSQCYILQNTLNLYLKNLSSS